MRTGLSKQIYISTEDYDKLKLIAKHLEMGFSKPRDIVELVVDYYMEEEKINETK